jgi:anthranilate phosphoribosyltransferase
LMLYGLASDLRVGVEKAQAIVRSGEALRKLDALVAMSCG